MEVSAEKLIEWIRAQDIEDREGWLEALRSGKYEQGQEKLRTVSDQYCCLGVYAEVCKGVQWGVDENGEEDDWMAPGAFVGSNDDSYVPHEWIEEPVQQILAAANDYGLTFEQIAQAIDPKGGELSAEELEHWGTIWNQELTSHNKAELKAALEDHFEPIANGGAEGSD